MPTVDSTVVSSPATMNVTELTSRSPVAARWPSRHAIVIPPAQMPATSAWSAPVISQATSTASLQAAT